MSRLSTAQKYAQPDVVQFWTEFATTGLQACEQDMLTRYAPAPPARVLDLGCGSGRAGLALMPQGYDVTGLDLAWQMVDAARGLSAEKGLDAELVQADARALPCQSASYEIALIFIAAIQHIPTRLARQKTLTEIARVLKARGVLILALDNLAPALTCYVWWGWKRITSPPRSNGGSNAGKGKADVLLESRRGGAGALRWHARGLARTLRWRTWTGAVDVVRGIGPLRGEIGDTEIEQVSLIPTRGRVYYHLYGHAELVADAAQAGLKLLGYHSGRELTEGKTFSARVRQLDKQVLYAFERAA